MHLIDFKRSFFGSHELGLRGYAKVLEKDRGRQQKMKKIEKKLKRPDRPKELAKDGLK